MEMVHTKRWRCFGTNSRHTARWPPAFHTLDPGSGRDESAFPQFLSQAKILRESVRRSIAVYEDYQQCLVLYLTGAQAVAALNITTYLPNVDLVLSYFQGKLSPPVLSTPGCFCESPPASSLPWSASASCRKICVWPMVAQALCSSTSFPTERASSKCRCWRQINKGFKSIFETNIQSKSLQISG